jgi:multiple sugar transport system substrate-binding protein
MVDFIEPGYFEDLTPKVKADSAIEWNDIGNFFRSFRPFLLMVIFI